jgi:subtilase family serine protease
MNFGRFRWWVTGTAAVLAVSSAAAAAATPSAGASSSVGRAELNGSAAPAATLSHPVGTPASTSTVSFQLELTLRDAAGAQDLLKEVSSPGSAQFHHFLTDAQWEARFSPTAAQVASAKSWLKSEGFSVGAVPADRLWVSAQGTAAQVEGAFGTTLGLYKVNGNIVRKASANLSVPASLAGVVSGVVGINQSPATTDLTEVPAAASANTASPNQEPPPPAGFRNPQPCSGYWGQKIDTADSGSLYTPYTSPLPYDICGYKPPQLRSGYGINASVGAGKDGSGVTLAIVDAYDSPTLLTDAQHYFRVNDPTYPLSSSQFTNIQPASVGNEAVCAASGWYAEQALDVESSHSMAPGANILFVGAQDCFDSSLMPALNTAVTSGASVVSDSWGQPIGDLTEDVATRSAYDTIFMMAGATGVSVLFSSGDFGDNFAITGLTAPDFPPSSPYVTAVGGTTLEVGKGNKREAEFGWSTGKQILCAGVPATNCGSATSPTGALAFNAAGGGGTSYSYSEPYYQTNVVPSALAARNAAVTGIFNRVEPDISMDGDAQSGMLIGLTQTFPDGTYYDQFKEGGTSLASPLLAGVIADTVQQGGPLGFLNPILYKADTTSPMAFNDITLPTSPLSTAVLRVDYANTVDNSKGYNVSLRVIDFQGKEMYCDQTGNCATRKVTLKPAAGFDSMTGIGTAGPKFIEVISKY